MVTKDMSIGQVLAIDRETIPFSCATACIVWGAPTQRRKAWSRRGWFTA